MAVNLPQSYRALIESSDELIWSVDLNHRLRAFNSTFLRHAHAIYGVHTGVDPCAEELAPTEMVSAFSSFYTRAMADGAFRLEHSLLDGQILEMAFSPTLSEDNITGVSVFARDITERRAAENAFRQAEKKYRDIFEGAIEGIFQSSPNGEVWSLNVAMARMLGYKSPREFKAKVRTLAQDVWADPEERAKYLHLLEENGELNGYECQCKCKDGKLIWVSLKVRRMLGRDGQLLYYHGFIEDISDRRLVAQALAERELLFRQFFEANGSMMLLIDSASGAIVDANPAAAAYYGYTRQQLTEMTISQINMLSPKEVFAEWRKAFDKEQNHFIFPHRLASGEMRDVEVYSSPVTVTGRHLLFSIVHDITERRQAQQALAEKESLYRQFFEGNGSVILLIDPSNETIFDANEAALAFYGYSREEMIGMSIVQINPRPAEAIQADLKLAVQRGRNHLFLLQRLSSGELRDVEVHSSPVSMGGRQLLFSIIQDITERNRTTLKLADSEARFRRFFEESGSIMLLLNLQDGRIGLANQAAAAFYGYTQEQLNGMAISQLNSLSDEQVATDISLVSDQKVKCFHRVHRLASGELRDVEVYCSSLVVSGTPMFFSIIHDVTKRVEAESRLRDSEEQFRATFEQAAVGIQHTSLEGRFLRSNQRFAEIVGYAPEEIPGLTYQQITYPEDLLASNDMLSQLSSGTIPSARFEKRYIRKDGSLVWVKLTVSIQRDGEGRPLHFITVIQDINARKIAEQELVASKAALQVSEARYRNAFQTSETRYRAAFDLSLQPTSLSRAEDGRYMEVNSAWLTIMGYELDEVVGRTVYELGVFADPSDGLRLRKGLNRDSVFREFRAQFRKKDGTVIWGLMSASVIELDGIPCILTVTQDLTAIEAAQEKVAAAQEATRSSNARLRAAFEINLDLSAISRMDSTYIEVNAEFLKVLGYEREEVIGKTAAELQILAQPDDVEKLAEKFSRDHMCRGLMLKFRKKSGEAFWGEMSASVADLDGVPHVFSSVRDLSATLAAEDEIYKLAFLDPLTSLPNRRLLLDELRQAQANAIRSGLKQTLLMIDLDNFKALNDSLGHSLGDLMLQEVAQRITSCLGKADTVARIGGDEL